MEKKIPTLPLSSIDHLRYLTKLDDKQGQSSSEFPRAASTSRLTKVSRLKPLDKVLFARKIAELSALNQKSRISHTESPTPRRTEVLKMAAQSSRETSHSESPTRSPVRKVSRKTKLSNSLLGHVEQAEQFKQQFSTQVNFLIHETQSAQVTFRETPTHSETVPQQQSQVEEKNNKPLLQPRVRINKNLSLPLNKVIRRANIQKALILPKKDKAETMPTQGNCQVSQQFKAIFSGPPYRYLVFGPQVDIEKLKSYVISVHNGLSYSIKSLKNPSEKYICSKQVSLLDPPTKKTKTLLLDLDETLVHLCRMRQKPDVVLELEGEVEKAKRKIPLKIRPFLKEFIVKMSAVYEVVIFTASAQNYAQTIVNYINGENCYISSILSRDNCMQTRNGYHIKDLRIIKGRELKNMIIVDNLVHSFGFQLDNGVPISEFLDDKKDEELKFLADYLIQAAKYDDIRVFNREKLKLLEMSKTPMDEILNKFSEFQKPAASCKKILRLIVEKWLC